MNLAAQQAALQVNLSQPPPTNELQTPLEDTFPLKQDFIQAPAEFEKAHGKRIRRKPIDETRKKPRSKILRRSYLNIAAPWIPYYLQEQSLQVNVPPGTQFRCPPGFRKHPTMYGRCVVDHGKTSQRFRTKLLTSIAKQLHNEFHNWEVYWLRKQAAITKCRTQKDRLEHLLWCIDRMPPSAEKEFYFHGVPKTIREYLTNFHQSARLNDLQATQTKRLQNRYFGTFGKHPYHLAQTGFHPEDVGETNSLLEQPDTDGDPDPQAPQVMDVNQQAQIQTQGVHPHQPLAVHPHQPPAVQPNQPPAVHPNQPMNIEGTEKQQDNEAIMFDDDITSADIQNMNQYSW